MLGSGNKCVERERPSRERGAVLAKALRGRTGHRDPERRVSGELLGASGGVDHHALAGARRADEDGGTLGAGDDLKRVRLLVAEARADPLGEPVARDPARPLTHIPTGGPGQLRDPALDRLLSRAYRERRHPPTLQREHAALGDHPPRASERLGWGEFAGGLLK